MRWGWRGTVCVWPGWEACGNGGKEGELVAQLRVNWVETVTFHSSGEKGLRMVCFVSARICRAAGKVLFLACSRPCRYRRQLSANTQHTRGSGGPGIPSVK